MSIFTIKVIACIAMALSHFGSVFSHALPSSLAQGLYLLGRISFPIFAYLLVNGWNQTHSKKEYARHLLVFALLSQIPFTLAHYHTIWPVSLNVLFTLFFGSMCLYAIDQTKQENKFALFFVPLLVFSSVPLKLDFGWLGIFLIFLMGLFQSKYIRICILTAGMAILYLKEAVNLFYFCSFLCVLPGIVMLLFLNTQKKCIRGKYFFYFFYPVHLLVLYMASLDF